MEPIADSFANRPADFIAQECGPTTNDKAEHGRISTPHDEHISDVDSSTWASPQRLREIANAAFTNAVKEFVTRFGPSEEAGTQFALRLKLSVGTPDIPIRGGPVGISGVAVGLEIKNATTGRTGVFDFKGVDIGASTQKIIDAIRGKEGRLELGSFSVGGPWSYFELKERADLEAFEGLTRFAELRVLSQDVFSTSVFDDDVDVAHDSFAKEVWYQNGISVETLFDAPVLGELSEKIGYLTLRYTYEGEPVPGLLDDLPLRPSALATAVAVQPEPESDRSHLTSVADDVCFEPDSTEDSGDELMSHAVDSKPGLADLEHTIAEWTEQASLPGGPQLAAAGTDRRGPTEPSHRTVAPDSPVKVPPAQSEVYLLSSVEPIADSFANRPADFIAQACSATTNDEAENDHVSRAESDATLSDATDNSGSH